VSARAAALAERRLALLARSEQLRLELGADLGALATRLQVADRFVALARSGLVRVLVVAGAALLLFGRPRQLFRTAGRLLLLWPLLRPFLPDLAAWWRNADRP